jgi:two-component system CheB/CheR fusion protein
MQNILADPPSTKLDILSCRNLLIYLTAELQKKLLPLFHYTINPGGFLFLGSSESMGSFTDLFSLQDNKWKLFERREMPLIRREAMNFQYLRSPTKSG